MGGGSYPSDYRVVDKDGQIHTVRAVSRPFADRKGRNGVIGVISEIANWETLDKALRQSEVKVKKLLEYSKDGILLTDESGTLIEWNPAMEQISGIPRTGAVGRPIWEVQYAVLPTEKKILVTPSRIREMFEDLLTTGIPLSLDRSTENEIERPDMTRRVIESFQYLIPTENGRIVAAIVRDITDHRRADLAVKEANRKLNLMSSITRHDINNQLHDPDRLPFAAGRGILCHGKGGDLQHHQGIFCQDPEDPAVHERIPERRGEIAGLAGPCRHHYRSKGSR